MRTARLVLLAIVAAAIGSATVGAASSLTTASGDYGAGGAAVTNCGATAGITTTYTIVSGKVTEVILSNIPSTCNTGSLRATLTNNGNSVATAGPATVPNNGAGSVKLTVAAQPASSTVTDVRVVIVGP